MRLLSLSSGASDWEPTGKTQTHTEVDPLAHLLPSSRPRVFKLVEYRSDRLRTTIWFQAKDMA